jgi:hypothetical protein
MLNLNQKEIESLELFAFKVDMEGFNYALENYGPKEKVFKPLYSLSALEAEDFFDDLRDHYNIEIS